MNSRNVGAEVFQERSFEYRYARLKETWSSCPVCGGKRLERPAPSLRRIIPEAEGVCGTCGAALMSASGGKSRALAPRRP